MTSENHLDLTSGDTFTFGDFRSASSWVAMVIALMVSSQLTVRSWTHGWDHNQPNRSDTSQRVSAIGG